MSPSKKTCRPNSNDALVAFFGLVEDMLEEAQNNGQEFADTGMVKINVSNDVLREWGFWLSQRGRLLREIRAAKVEGEIT